MELIGDDTPWVRDYRGLWGLDTHDPFGGEPINTISEWIESGRRGGSST